MYISKEHSETEYLDCIQYPNKYAAVKSGLESSVDKFVATVFNRRRQRYFLWNTRPTPFWRLFISSTIFEGEEKMHTLHTSLHI